jgi:hypothetical protein
MVNEILGGDASLLRVSMGDNLLQVVEKDFSDPIHKSITPEIFLGVFYQDNFVMISS